MVYLTGDTHGPIDFQKLSLTTNPFLTSLTSNDYIIICGDFGAVWDGSKDDMLLQAWYSNQPWTTLFIDGNHENHRLLSTYPIEEWNGGKVHKINDKIFHLMRGQVYTIEGRTYFTMGGANSIDKWHRVLNRDWWVEEMPSGAEYEEGFNNLEVNHNKVDYILTHCAPDHILDALNCGYEHDKLTNYLEVISQSVQYSHWFCGHYHADVDVTDNFTILYDTIINVKEYDED